MKNLFIKSTLCVAMATAIVGCGSDNSNPTPEPKAAFKLQLLHFADMDGTSGALSNVENFSALLNKFRSDMPNNTLVLSSGDNFIPGPRYAAAAESPVQFTDIQIPGKGRADIAMLNAMGLQASVVGNHDLDGGTAEFASIIKPETNTETGKMYPGAKFPYLSQNLDFTTDANLANLVQANDKDLSTLPDGSLTGYGTLNVNGEMIGVVGASTPTLGNITNVGDITVKPTEEDTTKLAAEIQPAVDALMAKGVNKIILLAHMQRINVEKELATKLKGVDIIVAGGSNTLLADSNDTLKDGDVAADNYPLSYTSASNEPVLLVNTDGDYKYLGRLVTEFDSEGKILTNSLDDKVNGAYASTDAVVTKFKGIPIAGVSAIKTAMNLVLAELEGNILGNASVYLDGRRSQVRSQETNLGNLTADANLWYANQYFDGNPVVVSLKNGGGIRDDIGNAFIPAGAVTDELTFEPNGANAAIGKKAGDISQFDIQGSLRFNNGLVVADITADALRQVIEAGLPDADATSGSFPQVAGVKFSYDQTKAKGSRIQNMAVGNDVIVKDGVFQGDQNRRIKMVTLDFLADRSGLPFGELTNRVDLVGAEQKGSNDAEFAESGSEQDALAEFLLKNHADSANAFAIAETPESKDDRIQNLSERTDTVLSTTATVQ